MLEVAGGALPAAALDAPLPILGTDGALRQSSLRAEIAALQRAHPGENIGLYVWADWCPICKTIQGTVNGLTQDHPMITIAMQSGPPDKVSRYMASRGLAWRTVIDPRSAIPGALGFGAVPAFAVITPQMFRRAELTAALESANGSGISVSDEAMAMELAGFRPLLVEGSEDNIKVTTAADLALAEYLLLREQGTRNK